jgi:hypothetical protein
LTVQANWEQREGKEEGKEERKRKKLPPAPTRHLGANKEYASNTIYFTSKNHTLQNVGLVLPM